MQTESDTDMDASDMSNDPVEVPGLSAQTAPPADDHKQFAAWLASTALPRTQPTRMPQQRFEYWRLERPRPIAIPGPAPEGAAG